MAGVDKRVADHSDLSNRGHWAIQLTGISRIVIIHSFGNEPPKSHLWENTKVSGKRDSQREVERKS